MKPRGLVTAAALAAAACAALLAAPAESGSRKAKVEVVSQAPLTLRGKGFVPRERLTVKIAVDGATHTVRLRATARGTFLRRFSEIDVSECTPLAIRIVGGAGSRTALTKRFDAPPACGMAPQP